MTKKFPKSERYNLISQMNRCALSIPSNIAEGSAKSTNKHFKQYLEQSLGSAFEWETQMEAARLIKLVDKQEYEELVPRIQEIQRMIGAFIDRLSE